MTFGSSRRSPAPTLAAIALVFLMQDTGGIETSTSPRIEGLAARRDAGQIFVSFRVASAFHEDVVDRIQSGIPVTFKHRVRVMAKRGFPMMPAKEIGRTRIEAQVTYDALTGRYVLTRQLEFRRKKSALPPVTFERTTGSEDEMRRWMTEFADVPIYDPDPNASEPLTGTKVRVRADSNLGRKFVLLVFPTTRGDNAEIRLES